MAFKWVFRALAAENLLLTLLNVQSVFYSHVSLNLCLQ